LYAAWMVSRTKEHWKRPLVLLFALVISMTAACGGSQFIPEALDHARQAVERGKDRDPNALAEQASVALRYAQMAEREKASAHLLEGIRSLKSAIQHARYGRIAEGTKAAEDAVMSLFEAQ
jgi:small metal-binding protein